MPGLGISLGIGAGGGGGGAGIANPAPVDAAKTGAVAQLRASIKGALTWSKLSGASTIAISAAGVLSLSGALGAGGSASAVARVQNTAGDAIEKTITVRAAAVTQPTTPTVGQMIGGIAIGSVATSGPMAGMILTYGDDFDGPLDLMGPAPSRRFGRYGTTRGNYLIASAGQQPRASNGLGGVDADPYWTGHLNSNRGKPIASLSDIIVQGGGKLTLKQRDMLPAEAAHVPLNNKGVISSMVHGAFDCLVRAPCVVACREQRFTTAKEHFTLWLMQNMGFSRNDLELDIEAGSHANDTGDGRLIEFNSNVWVGLARDGDRSKGSDPVSVDHSTPHTYYIEITAEGVVNFWLDGVILYTLATEKTKALAAPFHWVVTAHMYNVPGRTVGVSSYDIHYVQYFASKHFAPKLPPMLVKVAAGETVTVTLPTQTDLWGEPVTEKLLEACMMEPNEPGGTVNGEVYTDLPPGVTLNASTRELTIKLDTPGRLNLGRYVNQPGCSSQPHRMVIEVGPAINIAELSVTQGAQVDIDIYKMIDFGVLVTDGEQAATTIEISPLASGLEFSNATGRLTGLTTAAVGSQNVTIRATNSVGQQSTVTAVLKISAKPVNQTYEYMSYSDLVADFDGDRDDRFASQTGAINAWLNIVANAGDLSKPASVSVSPERVTGVKAGRSAVLFRRGSDGATSTVLESPQNCPLTSILQGTDSAWTLLIVSCPLAALTGSVAGWGEQIDNGSARNAGLVRRSPGTGSTPVVSSMRAGNTTQNSSIISVGPIPDGAWNVTLLRHANGVSDAWVNRVRVAEAVAHTSTTVWTTAARFGIGNLQGGIGQASRYPGTGFDGYVGQVIAFKAALTDTQSALLMNNMHSKWSIA